jgi:hypothetical protein
VITSVSPFDHVTTRSVGVAAPVKIHKIPVPAVMFWQDAALVPFPSHVHVCVASEQTEPPALAGDAANPIKAAASPAASSIVSPTTLSTFLRITYLPLRRGVSPSP